MRVAGDLKVNHIHVSVNGINQFPHAEGLLFISTACLVLDRGGGGRGWEFGKGSSQDSSEGSPRPLPSLVALLGTPHQTHDVGLKGQ